MTKHTVYNLFSNYFYVWAFVLYLVVYLVYFSANLRYSVLPGQFDVWFNMAILKDYSNIFDHFILGSPLTTANFPEGKIFLYGEASFLSGPLYWLLLKLTQNDFTAFISMYALVYALNSISLAYFVSRFCKVPVAIGFLTGLIFSFSAFNLGLRDNFIYSIFFPVFLGLYCLELGVAIGRRFNFFVAALCFSLQIYFSVYNFFMGLLIAMIWAFIKFGQVKRNFRLLVQSALLMIFIISPFVYLYGLPNPTTEIYNNFLTLKLIDSFGFSVPDLFRSFSSNLVYGKFFPLQKAPIDYWHMGNLGIVSSLFALIGLVFAPRPQRIFILLLVCVGALFSFGMYYGSIKSPLYYLFTIVPFLKNFKLIFKFYYLVVLGFVIGYTFFLKIVYAFTGNLWIRPVILLLPVTIFLTENLPLNRIENGSQFKIFSLDSKELTALQHPGFSALILPAYAPVLPKGDNECFTQGRVMEYKYYYAQTHYRFNLINGCNLFAPTNRQLVQNILDKNSLNSALNILQKNFSLKAIIFDKTSSVKCGSINIDSLAAELPLHTEHPDYIYFPLPPK